MSKIEDEIWKNIQPAVNELGIRIYDIEYLKEGTSWYLRIYIDKDESISIEDCEKVSRAIDPLIDKLDLIKTAFCLEVSSPGLERTLRRLEHFEKNLGKLIDVSLFKAVDGSKKLQGILKSASPETLCVSIDDKELEISRENVSVVKTVFEF